MRVERLASDTQLLAKLAYNRLPLTHRNHGCHFANNLAQSVARYLGASALLVHAIGTSNPAATHLNHPAVRIRLVFDHPFAACSGTKIYGRPSDSRDLI